MKKFNSFKFLGSLALASTLLTGSALLSGCSSTGTNSTTTTTTSSTTTVYSQFLYVVNQGPAGTTPGVSEFVQHLDTGALTAGVTAASQALFPTGNSPNSIAINPGGQFAYVANRADNTISQYQINSSDGSWGAIGSPGAYGGSGQPQGGVVDPTGRWYFTANNVGGDISSFAINGNNGALGFVSNTTQTTAGAAGKVGGFVVDPTASFVYAGATNGVYLYAINNSTGALSPQSPTASISGLGTINGGACDTSGHVFFSVGSGATSGLVAFNIASTGQLTQYTNGLPILPSGSNPTAVVYEPSHQALFVAETNAGAGSIVAFSVNPSTGSLTQVGTAVTAGTNLNSLAFDPTGSFLYCSNTNNPGTIGAFQIGNGGVLSAINSGAGFGTNQFPTQLRTLQYAQTH